VSQHQENTQKHSEYNLRKLLKKVSISWLKEAVSAEIPSSGELFHIRGAAYEKALLLTGKIFNNLPV